MNASECYVCKSCATMRVVDEPGKFGVEKCRDWLENCTLDEDDEKSTTCSCTSTDCTSSTYDSNCYDSNGMAVVEKVYGPDGENLNKLNTVLNQNQNIYQNVKVRNSKKVHLGNITYITGPIVVNNNTGSPLPIKQSRRDENSLVRYVERTHWLAQPPLDDYTMMEKPAKYVIITHSASEDSRTHAQNMLLVRIIQQFHIESRGWDDIGYNFLIGCDGSAYVGRGWGVVGAHTLKYNKISVGICFIGCFMRKIPPEVSLNTAKALIEEGVKKGYIDKNYSLIGHCQCLPTESPGRRLFDEIKTWPHFDNSVSVDEPSTLIS